MLTTAPLNTPADIRDPFVTWNSTDLVAAPASIVTFRAMTPTPGIPSSLIPRDTFLSSSDVFARYGWGRTKGYEMLRTAGFPAAIGGRYRLDTLYRWEDAQLACVSTPSPQAVATSGDLPPAQLPARRTRRAA